MIDITQLYSKTGYFTLDPGFSSTGACISTTTYIDGDKGELLDRGYPIETLAKYSLYIEVCQLLIYGHLPSQKELQLFQETMVSEMIINEKLIEFYKGFTTDSHPMAIIVGALSALMYKDFDVNDPRIETKMPTLAAYIYRTALGLPIIENFLYIMFPTPINDFNVDKVNQTLSLCCMQIMNKMHPLTLFVLKIKFERNQMIQCFGKDLKSKNDILELAIQLEQAALKDDYFIQRKSYLNVDFYTGIVYEALNIPTSMFTIMFIVQRSIGWICQWMEMMLEKVQRISRPSWGRSEKEEEKSRVCKLPMHNSLFGLVNM